MKYRVRPMLMGDVPQVSVIEREVFPSQWPPTAYKRELQNKLAHYLVAFEEPEPGQDNSPDTGGDTGAPPPGQDQDWLSRIKSWFGKERLAGAEKPVSVEQFVVGAVGFWLMLDEAHITTIGVRESYQRRGIGELLLIKTIELAQELGARLVTLEVRVTNSAAQALYEKYGFNRVGLRRRYYSDNGEDALIMTTNSITSAAYQAGFQRLKEAHTQKWDKSG